jgi:hypothetical protein
MPDVQTDVSVPRHALEAGRWDVRELPFGARGDVTRTLYETRNPPAEFYLAVFDRPITGDALADILGEAGDPRRPQVWQGQWLPLRQAGLLLAWGGDGGAGLNPCGYFPGTKLQGAPLTGKFVDVEAWSYASSDGNLWIAEWAPVACEILGFFEQAPA